MPAPKGNQYALGHGQGRPSSYTQEKADEICELIVSGFSLKAICALEGFPSITTVLRWVEANDDFRRQYARSQSLKMEHLAEELMEISDDGSNDYMEQRRKNGEVFIGHNQDHIQRSRLRVDTRKWLMSKLAPKKYSEKVVLSGDEDSPIKHEHNIDLRALTEDERAALKHIIARLEGDKDEAVPGSGED